MFVSVWVVWVCLHKRWCLRACVCVCPSLLVNVLCVSVCLFLPRVRKPLCVTHVCSCYPACACPCSFFVHSVSGCGESLVPLESWNWRECVETSVEEHSCLGLLCRAPILLLFPPLSLFPSLSFSHTLTHSIAPSWSLCPTQFKKCLSTMSPLSLFLSALS